MEEKKVDTQVEAKKLEDAVKTLEAISDAESKVKNNSIEFKVPEREELFRVRMPTIREKMEINKDRMTIIKTLQSEGFLYEEELKKELKEKQGIDILAIEKELSETEIRLNDLRMRLVPEVHEESRLAVKKEITDLLQEQVFLITKKSKYLEAAIENQVIERILIRFTSAVLEKQEDDKWVSVFKNYEDFINSQDAALVDLAMNYTYRLMF